jgi:precorrin-4 methylase
MEKIIKDYVLYDRANNSLVKFDSGDIVLYGDKDEAMEDCYGNEEVIQFENLSKDKQKEIINQLNK